MTADDANLRSGGPVRTTDLGEVPLSKITAVLRDGLARLDDAGIAHAIMGGLAVTTLARPRWTHDIDVFLRPRDAAAAMQVLAETGYDTEAVDHEWLFKATRDGITIDLIFRSRGNVYFDDEMEARCIERDFFGVPIRVLCPEDLLVIKAAADTELNHYHWYDALAVMARHQLDWSYVLRRARSSQRRLLSLLIYADGADVDVPPWVIRALSETLYDPARWQPPADHGTAEQLAGESSPRRPNALEEGLRQRLRSHRHICDLDIGVTVEDDTVIITGEVETPARRDQVSEAAAEILPDWNLRNDVSVRQIRDSHHVEVVS